MALLDRIKGIFNRNAAPIAKVATDLAKDVATEAKAARCRHQDRS